MPERHRAVIVLCDLEGLTQQQAARHLGWPLGTVQSRLARGRERLCGRLTRRGLAPSVGLLSAAARPSGAGGGPGSAGRGDRPDCGVLVAGRTTTAGAVPAAVAELMEGVLRTMFLSHLKRIAVAVVALAP